MSIDGLILREDDKRQLVATHTISGKPVPATTEQVNAAIREAGFGELALLGDARVLGGQRAAVEGDGHIAAAERLGVGLVGPDRGVDVGGGVVLAEEVEGEQAELDRGAAGHEEHRVVAADARGLAAGGLGLVVEVLVEGAAVGELEEADAAAAAVDELLADLLEHALGHAGRTGAEVVDAALRRGLREERAGDGRGGAGHGGHGVPFGRRESFDDAGARW